MTSLELVTDFFEQSTTIFELGTDVFRVRYRGLSSIEMDSQPGAFFVFEPHNALGWGVRFGLSQVRELKLLFQCVKVTEDQEIGVGEAEEGVIK